MNDTPREVEQFIVRVNDLIRALLERERITQKEFAKRSGVSEAYLSQILSGKKKNITIRILAKIGVGLGYRFVLEPRRKLRK